MPVHAEPLEMPIQHEPFFRGERELLEYSPNFIPDVATFDIKNQMHIRDKDSIQVLTHEKGWERQRWTPVVADYFKRRGQTWDGRFKSGTHYDRRIVFHENNSSWMVVHIERKGVSQSLLLYTVDSKPNWSVTPLAHPNARIVGTNSPNTLKANGPILLMSDRRHRLYLQLPAISNKGKLELRRPILIAEDAFLPEMHSGLHAMAIRHGNQVLVTYAGRTEVEETPGTPQYVVGYEIHTNRVWGPILLGVAPTKLPDIHATPVIATDSTNTIHIVFGGHHTPVSYVHSLKPDLPEVGFTAPRLVAAIDENPAEDRHTYCDLVTASDGNIHLFTRWTRPDYRMGLSHRSYNPKTGIWGPIQELVRPFRAGYSIWYHQLSTDRKGNIYLGYRSYVNFMSPEEVQAYINRFPERPAPIPDIRDKNITAYDPVLLKFEPSNGEWNLVPDPSEAENTQ